MDWHTLGKRGLRLRSVLSAVQPNLGPEVRRQWRLPLGNLRSGDSPCIFFWDSRHRDLGFEALRLWTSRRYACKSASNASRVNRSNFSETPSAGGGTGTQLRLVLSHVLSSRTSHLWERLGVLPRRVFLLSSFHRPCPIVVNGLLASKRRDPTIVVICHASWLADAT